MTATIEDRAQAPSSRPHVTVLTDRCAGCQECVIRCPAGALSMDTSRWVAVADDELCVGCRQCTRTCPFSAITVTGPVAVAERTEPAATAPVTASTAEIRAGFATWDEALIEANRCLDCPDPTCERGCPAHNNIPAFIAAIRDGDLAKAHDILRATTVLPDVCSRVCDQSAQCEGSCTWSLADGKPVSIGKLERFVADNAPVPTPHRDLAGDGVPGKGAPGADLSVAVIGSGPAGIGAAWQLVEAGASVTVYERDEQPGGLIDWGIPDFTLPNEFAQRPWQQLTEAGVELRCGTEVSADGVSHLLDDYDAVILAHGAPVPIRPPVPGSDLEGVTDATSFLKDAKAALRNDYGLAVFAAKHHLPAKNIGASGKLDPEAPLILVLGAGNTAMDVARSARRLGLRAICVDWVDERFAIARPDEIAEARHEGVDIRFLRTLARLEGTDGRVSRATLTVTRQEHADRKPELLKGHTEDLAVSLVVMAMGYRNDTSFTELLPGTPRRREATGMPDRHWLASGILSNPAPEFAHHKPVGKLALGREVGLRAALLPYQERVWAAGDAVVGPSTVVEAMTQGKLAAAAVIGARPSRNAPRNPGRVLVGYDSHGGRTAEAAKIIASQLRSTGAVVRTVPLSQVDATELSSTDLLVVGTWVEGLVVTKVAPAKVTRHWLAELPRLAGLRTAVFCTYGVSPHGALDELRAGLEGRGARVIGQDALGPHKSDIEAGAAKFAAKLVELAWTAPVS